MVNRERLELMLKSIEVYGGRIAYILPKDLNEYEKLDQNLKAAVERYLQLISDKEIDLLSQLYKELSLGIVGDSESLIALFEGRLNKPVLNEIIERRTLRNYLVHAYSIGAYDRQVFDIAKKIVKGIKALEDGVRGLVEKR